VSDAVLGGVAGVVVTCAAAWRFRARLQGKRRHVAPGLDEASCAANARPYVHIEVSPTERPLSNEQGWVETAKDDPS
jgi:hypothetical protein